MIPNIVHGGDVRGLMCYLQGPGRGGADTHVDPRIIAGHHMVTAHHMGPLSRPDAIQVARIIDTPRLTVYRGEPVLSTRYAAAKAAMATGVPRDEAIADATHEVDTWHCSLSLGSDEGELTDAKWAAIADDFMTEMGFIEVDGVADVRWAAVRHGKGGGGCDHIHIAASIIREDGTAFELGRDHRRSQAVCNTLEHRHGLEVLASREEGGAEPVAKPGERSRQRRTGTPETDRDALRRRVRALATSTTSEGEWIREIRSTGIKIYPRYAKGGTDTVTGFSVQLPTQPNLATGKAEKAIRFSGLHLARDLTITALREWAGWDNSDAAHADALVEWGKGMRRPNSRRPVVADPAQTTRAMEALRQWSEQLAAIPTTDRATWAAVASQMAGVVTAWSLKTEPSPGPLDDLARSLARSAHLAKRERRVRPAPPRESGSPARMAALMLLHSGTDAAALRDSNDVLMWAIARAAAAIREADRAAEAPRRARQGTLDTFTYLNHIRMRRAGISPHVRHPERNVDGSPANLIAQGTAALVGALDLDLAMRTSPTRLVEMSEELRQWREEDAIGFGERIAHDTAPTAVEHPATSRGTRPPTTGRNRGNGR